MIQKYNVPMPRKIILVFSKKKGKTSEKSQTKKKLPSSLSTYQSEGLGTVLSSHSRMHLPSVLEIL